MKLFLKKYLKNIFMFLEIIYYNQIALMTLMYKLK